MNYLLDTNAVIAMISGVGSVGEEIRRHRLNEFGVPSVVEYELHAGALGSASKAQSLAKLDALPFPAVDFDREDAREAGRIRVQLEHLGTPIGPIAVLIAAQVLTRDLTLVTHNTREFERVPGLRLADWE